MKSTKEWRRTSVQGLYEFRTAGLPESTRGVYYSRYSVKGVRTFRSLETSVFEHAKLKHTERMAEVERSRVRPGGAPEEFRTLGALAEELERRLARLNSAPNTVASRKNSLARLRRHWLRGSFDAYFVRNVSVDLICELRDHLGRDAVWTYRYGGERKGYRPDVVNQTLWVLRILIDIAVEKMAVVDNPFTTSTALRGRLFSRKEGRERSKANIPSRPDMIRILAEMRRVPENSDTYYTTPQYRAYLEQTANEKADHAELLAFSGMRRSEATAATVADDLGDELVIHGTKSASSNRTIPVNAQLRAVLDRIKSRRVGDKTKLLVTEDIRGALIRACRRLGLPAIRIHDLRHFFASACLASGIDVPTVSRWLGHADGGALAMRIYGHLLKDHSQAAAKRVDFSGTTAQSKTA